MIGIYRKLNGQGLLLFGCVVSCHVLSTHVGQAVTRLSEGHTEELGFSIVMTQAPLQEAPASLSTAVWPGYVHGEQTRLVLRTDSGVVRVLSGEFYSACEPTVSFDGVRVLFAGCRERNRRWNIHEMDLTSRYVRQITADLGDCREPMYQSTLYTIISTKPWYQISFMHVDPLTRNEAGSGWLTNLYSCKLDGSALRRLTYNLSSEANPQMMPDGRIVYAAWQRGGLDRGVGRIGLFHINTDGADMAAFAIEQGKRFKRMPCVVADQVIFVESDTSTADNSGTLGSVTLRRPLHSYRALTQASDGLFLNPTGLPDGRVLVSHRGTDRKEPYRICIWDPETRDVMPVYTQPGFHCIEAKAVIPTSEPDGRSSVVTEKDPHGKLYCLDVYNNDLKRSWLPKGSVQRVRVLEGVPLSSTDEVSDRRSVNGVGPLAQRRVLGEIDLEKDGSFNLEIPANIPVELQILDEQGLALRTCNWIWAKNHEPRGCIGCHEDNELTPENLLVDAIKKPSVTLTLAPEQRRTVDFRRDVMPILSKHCVSCHRRSNLPIHLTETLDPEKGDATAIRFNRSYESLLSQDINGLFKWVHPGRARTSPLVWSILHDHTARPWDQQDDAPQVKPMPPQGDPLSAAEKRTIIEWIDLGAAFNGLGE